MDNAMYDEVDLTPISTDETYSRLRATETKINPSYELQKTEDIDHHALKGVKQTNVSESPNSTKFSTAMIIMMVILLLITLTSIALSATTFNRLYEQSKVLRQLENTNNGIKSAFLNQLEIIQMNLSQQVLELVIAQTNISQNLNQLDTNFENSIPLLAQYLSTQTHCGPGLWHRFIYLNMSDPSQQCPSAWREYNTNGVKACGRPTNSTGSCASVQYLNYQQYSRVCGRVIGYQHRSPDAFRQHANTQIEFDGINITIGAQHIHIWSYVVGHRNTDCPCASNSAASPPQSIGDNYHCDTGDTTLSDPLWDGQQCKGTCCTGTNTPPWFSVQLPASTTDAIEVSICCDQDTDDEDVPVELIEIFVR